jgi:non-lysosomal glucosylceramidase
LNNEASVVICDYGKAERPLIPFPYFAETMTGFEYTAAVLMMNWGMVGEGLECVRNIRLRYDGEKRNPWDEAECGHHYARAMSAWSAVLALSGFNYNGAKESVIAVPLVTKDNFKCFWSTGTGWGTYSLRRQTDGTSFAINVLEGTLACRSCEIAASGTAASAHSGGNAVESHVSHSGERMVVSFGKTQRLTAKDEIRIEVRR